MKKGTIIFVALILLIIIWLVYVKMSKNAEKKSSNPIGMMKGKKSLTANGFIVSYANMNDKISANGNIIANDEVLLQPEVAGRVTFINIKEGAFVSKGTLLLKVNDAELQAQVSKNKTQLKIAQNNVNRLAELLQINGVSQSEYDAAINIQNNIKADINLLNVQIAKTELHAPFSGKLGLRNISVGAFVSPTTIVSTLQNINILKMDFTVPEKYAGMIQIGSMLQCSAAGVDNFFAKVIAIEPSVDENTRNQKLRATIINPNSKLVPGIFVKVALQIKEEYNSILVPSSAVIPDDRATKVVKVNQGKAQFVNVEIGIRTEDEVQVLSGLNIGDTVLTTGLLQVKPDMDIKIMKVSNNNTNL